MTTSLGMVFEGKVQKTIMNTNKYSVMVLGSFYKFFILFVILPLGACATHANSQTKKDVTARLLQRQEAVKTEIRRDLNIGERYIDYGFAPEKIIKPQSFKRLDSLYGAFYTEESKKGSSRNKLANLRSEIALEQDKVLKDTVHFQYELPHFFGVSRGDSVEITFASFYLDAKNSVMVVKIDYVFTIPNNLTNFYSAYTRRESFVEFGYLPSRDESDFYNLFDEVANTLTNAEIKGNFIGHTLYIMRAAHQQKGFGSESLIKQHVINIVTANVKDYKPVKWSRVYADFDDNDVIVSYSVDHEWTYKDPFGVVHNMTRRFVLNPYFEIQIVEEIGVVRE